MHCYVQSPLLSCGCSAATVLRSLCEVYLAQTVCTCKKQMRNPLIHGQEICVLQEVSVIPYPDY